MGSPGSLLQVGLPASTPLYARRKSLLAVSTSSNTDIDQDQKLNLVSTLNLTTRFLSFQWPPVSLYQKLTSTVPLSITLNTVKQPHNSSIAVVSLDGRIDWTVSKQASVLAYSPLQASSLSILPSHGSSSLVTGRGIVALTGSAPNIFKVSLEAGESFLVARTALLAYSLDDTAGVSRKSLHPKPERIASTVSLEDQPTDTPATATNNASYLKRFGSKLASWSLALWTRLRSDNTPFVSMYGPSTLLVQSSSTTPLFGQANSNSSRQQLQSLVSSTISKVASPSSSATVNSLESQIAAQLISNQENKAKAVRDKRANGYPQDYLKIATVVVDGPDRKVSFESTPTFKDF